MSFGIVGFTISAVVAASFANSIVYGGQTLSAVTFLVLGVCVLVTVLLATPLLVLTPLLIRVKRKGLLDYGVLATQYVKSFEQKWICSAPSETLLGTADIQSLADLSNSFQIVDNMRVILLLDRHILLGLTAPVAAPMILLLLMLTPAEKLLRVMLELLH